MFLIQRFIPPRSLALLLAVALATAGRPASADPGDACVTAYEGAQQARTKGGLVRSKAELRLCVGVCPSELAKDCQRWLGEIEKQIARLTVVVRGRAGGSVANEKLFVDGVERVSGDALELDPGRHELRVEAPGHASRTELVEVAAGTSAMRTVTIDRAAREARSMEASPDERPSLLGPLVLGGAGLAVLTAAAALAIAGHVDVSDMREEDGCAPTCPVDRVERVRALWTAGAVLAGAGAAAVIGSSIWLGVRASAAPPSSGAAVGSTAFSIHLGQQF